MEDYKAYQAIAQIKQIVHDAELCVANEIPCGSVLKRDLNRLEELAYIVRGYYDATKDNAFANEVASIHRHVFLQINHGRNCKAKHKQALHVVLRYYTILQPMQMSLNKHTMYRKKSQWGLMRHWTFAGMNAGKGLKCISKRQCKKSGLKQRERG